MANNYKRPTTVDLINNGKYPNAAAGTTVETLGYTSRGDGGGAAWSKTGVTGLAASQSPVALTDAKLTDANGHEWELVVGNVLRPKQLGAAATAGTDDGSALNVCADVMRAAIAAEGNQKSSFTIDLDGLSYETTISLDYTRIAAWGWAIRNGTIVGKCTGKAVMDFIGSRGGDLDFVVYGDLTNRPAIGVLFARSSTAQFAFCDNYRLHLSTLGYFSTAGAYCYGQETTHYDHCRFWNYDKDGYPAIHTGFDTVAFTSDYDTPVTGGTSFINNKYSNPDYRFVPVGNSFAITAVTNANPAVVTANGHSFVNGQTIVITQDIGGITEIANRTFVVANAAANTFELQGEDSTAYGVFTSGGNAIAAQSKPTVLLARCEQHNFDTAYIVNYGSDSLELNFPDGVTPENITIDALFEGSGSRSHIRFTGVTAGRTVRTFKCSSYNTACNTSFFSSDSVGAIVSVLGFDTRISSHTAAAVPLTDTPANYIVRDAHVFYPVLTGIQATSFNAFTGVYLAADNIPNRHKEPVLEYAQTGTFVPVVTSTGGTITAYVVNSARAVQVGKMLHVALDVTITTLGTATGALLATMPAVAAGGTRYTMTGRNYNTGNQLQTWLLAGSNSLSIATYSNGQPVVADGQRFSVSGWYEIS